MSLFDKDIINKDLSLDVIVNQWFEDKITEVVKYSYNEFLDQAKWKSNHRDSTLRDVIFVRLIDTWIDVYKNELCDMNIYDTTTYVSHIKKSGASEYDLIRINIILNNTSDAKVHRIPADLPKNVDFDFFVNDKEFKVTSNK